MAAATKPNSTFEAPALPFSLRRGKGSASAVGDEAKRCGGPEAKAYVC